MRLATPRGTLLLVGGLLACWPAAPELARAAPSSREIRVALFGQPCSLQGPADEQTLRVIHSLSPDQLYPSRESVLTSLSTKRSLEKLRAITGTPPALDRYRERLTKRLEAQLALLTAFESLRKDHKSAPVIAAGKAHLNARRSKEFERAVKKAEASKTLAKNDTLDSLFDSFSDGIEADPEEEFHRSIQRMGIQYACTFEEHSGVGEDGEDEDEEAPSAAEPAATPSPSGSPAAKATAPGKPK
jgi:hypothetical protein